MLNKCTEKRLCYQRVFSSIGLYDFPKGGTKLNLTHLDVRLIKIGWKRMKRWEMVYDCQNGCRTQYQGTDYINFDRKSLGMKKVCAKIVSENLINDQCQRRGEVCTDVLQQIEENCEWLNKIITGNESWVFQYDPGTDGQSWKSKSPGSSRS